MENLVQTLSWCISLQVFTTTSVKNRINSNTPFILSIHNVAPYINVDEEKYYHDVTAFGYATVQYGIPSRSNSLSCVLSIL
jgi:hypothetical protein